MSPAAGKGLVASSPVASVLVLPASLGDVVEEVLLMRFSLGGPGTCPGKSSGG